MKLTKEEAVRLFHEQWSDMQKELGDCPDAITRRFFKYKWCVSHFPGEYIDSSCFLCEYDRQVSKNRHEDSLCRYCPIAWPSGTCFGYGPNGINFKRSKISEILALPVREEAQ